MFIFQLFWGTLKDFVIECENNFVSRKYFWNGVACKGLNVNKVSFQGKIILFICLDHLKYVEKLHIVIL